MSINYTYGAKGAKSVQKSVRMTQETYDYIDTFHGDGFNQKFENACRYFSANQARVELQIESAEKELDRIRHEIYRMSKLSGNLSDIVRYMSLAANIVESDMHKLKLDEKD